jgi:aminoglycoside phosphotransferase (APT) family kinase protein
VGESLTWRVVGARLERELGEPVRDARWLTSPRQSRMTWAARTQTIGELVIKARRGDRAYDKTGWCAVHLPLLGARGYPVPAIVWHGLVGEEWHVVVQNRLPGHPLWPLRSLSWPMLDALLRLVELQADAGVPAGDRDFAGYVANVLFDDWDDVWRDAERASPVAAQLCARVRRWLQPVWGLRLPPADYANNDLNLSNILTDGSRITGVVDWDEFGLGSRALDLVVLAFDCERIGSQQAADHLLARAASIIGRDALRCMVSYRALVQLAGPPEGQDPSADAMAVVISAILDRLGEAQG